VIAAEAIRSIGIKAVKKYRWRKEFGYLQSVQVKSFKEFEDENTCPPRAGSDLKLDKMILAESATGNY
jgi:putative transposase